MSDIPRVLFGILAGHAIADYPLQGDFLAKAQNRHAPLPGVPWYHAMIAHAVIHGAAVFAVTGAWWLGALEAIAHAVIDDRKCAGKMTFDTDQALHIACKAAWFAAWLCLR